MLFDYLIVSFLLMDRGKPKEKTSQKGNPEESEGFVPEGGPGQWA